METSVTIGQIPTGWDIAENVALVGEVLAATRPGDVVVLPEGALSGYDTDLSPLEALDPAEVEHAVEVVADLTRRRAVNLFCGSLLFEQGTWCNAALHFSPDGERQLYRKINLAMNERGRLRAGSELPTLPVRQPAGRFTAGVQICREIRFPEQWQHLARSGADVFVYLTNAANPAEQPGTWRSHLISRAAENQRFLLASNVADARQHCPSMVVSPRGEVLAELPAGASDVIRLKIDLAEVSGWYLGQQRRDVLDLHYHPAPEPSN